MIRVPGVEFRAPGAGALGAGVPEVLGAEALEVTGAAAVIFNPISFASAPSVVRDALDTDTWDGPSNAMCAPSFIRRLMAIAVSGPLCSNPNPAPLPATSPGIAGSLSIRVIFTESARGLLTNTVSTPSSMPSDQAVTSYGGSGWAFGPRRTSG